MSITTTHFYELLKKSYKLSKSFFTQDKKLFAWIGLLFLISLIIAAVFLNVLLVNWSKRFFDALQNIDKKSFFKELYFFI